MSEFEAERALEAHGAYERDDDAFAVTTTPFDATVRVAPAGGGAAYRVTVRAPTLDAVVEGETVAPVVEDGWFETFALRVEDADGVVRVDPEAPTVKLDAGAGEVVVETRFETPVPGRGAEDAKAIVDYVEGTYLEGVIPGYDYRDPVAGMIDRAESGEGAPPL